MGVNSSIQASNLAETEIETEMEEASRSASPQTAKVLTPPDGSWADGSSRTRAGNGRLLTVREAADWANCHEETIRRAYLAGYLKARRFGTRNWRIYESDLVSWVDEGMKTRRVA